MGNDTQKPSYWAVLPARVRYDRELRPNAKLLYAEITAMADATGYCWATNDYLSKLFGLSIRTISDLVSTLGDRGYITVEVVRDSATNQVLERRLWVDKPAISEAPPLTQKSAIPMAEICVTPHAENCVENNNNLNNITPLPPRGGRRPKEPLKAPNWKPERFERFWGFYPRGEAKQAAIRAWDRLRPADALIDVMALALKRQLATEEWQRGVGVPYASTWLNGRRWEDTPGKLQAQARPVASGGRLIETEEVPDWDEC